MVYFLTKIRILVYFSSPFYFKAILVLLSPFGVFYLPTFGKYCGNLGIYIFSHFGMLEQEKSGNSVLVTFANLLPQKPFTKIKIS
jgi:hypothetical protein